MQTLPRCSKSDVRSSGCPFSLNIVPPARSHSLYLCHTANDFSKVQIPNPIHPKLLRANIHSVIIDRGNMEKQTSPLLLIRTMKHINSEDSHPAQLHLMLHKEICHPKPIRCPYTKSASQLIKIKFHSLSQHPIPSPPCHDSYIPISAFPSFPANQNLFPGNASSFATSSPRPSLPSFKALEIIFSVVGFVTCSARKYWSFLSEWLFWAATSFHIPHAMSEERERAGIFSGGMARPRSLVAW